MIIPKGKDVDARFTNAWWNIAATIGAETGIFIEVDVQYDGVGTNSIKRIVFILDGHEFETLPDLKRAIKMIAFV